MLAARRLRLASIRCVHPSHYAWSTSAKNLPMLQPTAMKWIRPLAAKYSKEAKPTEPSCNMSENSLKSNNIPITTARSDNTLVSSSCHSDISTKKNDKERKTQGKECSTGALADVGVKLPSKDQVESFLFKSLVYFWDFAYYIFCFCRKLVETYVLKNATVQANWKIFLKRMEDARKEIKPK